MGAAARLPDGGPAFAARRSLIAKEIGLGRGVRVAQAVFAAKATEKAGRKRLAQHSMRVGAEEVWGWR